MKPFLGVLPSLSVIVLEHVIGRCSGDECEILETAIHRRQDNLKMEQAEKQLKRKMNQLVTAIESVEFHDILDSLHPRLDTRPGRKRNNEFLVTVEDVVYVLPACIQLVSPLPSHPNRPSICVNIKDFPSYKAVRIFQDGTFYHIDWGEHWTPSSRLIDFIRFLWDHGFYNDTKSEP